MTAAAGPVHCGEASPAHFVSALVWKHITHTSIHLCTSCIQSMPALGVEIQGHLDFWFPPQSCIYLKLCLKVKTICAQMKKPLLIRFSTSCLPIPFHQESIFLSLCCQRLMRLSGYTCALRKIPLLSPKQYYSAQGHDRQSFKSIRKIGNGDAKNCQETTNIQKRQKDTECMANASLYTF